MYYSSAHLTRVARVAPRPSLGRAPPRAPRRPSPPARRLAPGDTNASFASSRRSVSCVASALISTGLGAKTTSSPRAAASAGARRRAFASSASRRSPSATAAAAAAPPPRSGPSPARKAPRRSKRLRASSSQPLFHFSRQHSRHHRRLSLPLAWPPRWPGARRAPPPPRASPPCVSRPARPPATPWRPSPPACSCPPPPRLRAEPLHGGHRLVVQAGEARQRGHQRAAIVEAQRANEGVPAQSERA